METPHNECMLALRSRVLFGVGWSETGYQRLDKFVLQSTRSLGVGDDLRGILGKGHGSCMQPPQPRHPCRRRSLRHYVAGGLKSQPAVAAPMAASASTGSEIEPHNTAPDERV